MGLYLCVFDASGEELEGVEIGAYADFKVFRDAVTLNVEGGVRGSVCPVLQGHSDCDGEWSPRESRDLLIEFDNIEKALSKLPSVEFNSDWKRQVSKVYALSPKNLLECFFDVDGELLITRLRQLAVVSVNSEQPILFQ
ncbi:Imm70 family immunity protein [Achromobacter kerstersii]|uniref:Imm70 family immunity protein n=1 Tax=Achromobacter kerstersii TaxID=1353890 RepID=UPI003D048BB5